jgi:hypothetical protein
MFHSCFTPVNLTRVSVCVCVCVFIHTYIHCYTYALLLYVYSYIFMYIYALLVLYSCFTSLDICNCCNPVLLQYTHSYSCCTRTLLVLFLLCVCVCVCRLTGLVECVQHSEGLRRDGGWEHDVLQQRAAGEAPLEEAAAHVCVLMHVGAAQARTRLRQERS